MKCVGDAALLASGFDGGVGAGSGWRTTSVPVTPGTAVRVRFILFDEHGSGYDSVALIDAFRWKADSLSSPITK